MSRDCRKEKSHRDKGRGNHTFTDLLSFAETPWFHEHAGARATGLQPAPLFKWRKGHDNVPIYVYSVDLGAVWDRAHR